MRKHFNGRSVISVRARAAPRASIIFFVTVYYKNVAVGNYQAGLFVEEAVIVELKVAKTYHSEDEAQLLNELKATGLKVGLLINPAFEESQRSITYIGRSRSTRSWAVVESSEKESKDTDFVGVQ